MSETTPPYETALSDAELARIRAARDYTLEWAEEPPLPWKGRIRRLIEDDIPLLLTEIDRLRRENALLRIARLTLPSAVTGLGEPVNCATATTVTHVAGHPVPDRRVVNAIIADLNRRGLSGEDV